MKAIIDPDLCTGCEACVGLCPAVFGMGDEDIAVVLVDPVPADAGDDCREAAEACPTEAISIEE